MSNDVIEQLYASFARLDHAGMAACYAPDATFSDPVFRDLRGPQVPAMWRMLCARAGDLRVTCSDVRVENDRGSARWQADYTFAKTKRPVHNVIEATFVLKDGKIVAHRDRFDLWRWTRMALGAPGVLFGWSPPMQNKVRAEAMKGLELFMKRHHL